MVKTGLSVELDTNIRSVLEKLKQSFELYLPDEKLSQIWQETEVISTEFSDFEAIFFEQELEGGKIFVSEEFEFFPIYALYLMTIYGAPNIIELGEMPNYDHIGIDEGTSVLQLSFSIPEAREKLMSRRIYLNHVKVGSIDSIMNFAQNYLYELQKEM